MYEYQATIVKVVDGDTIDVNIDLGMHIHVQTRLRILHINAAEHGTPAGDAATAYLRSQLLEGMLVTVRTQKDHTEKYGRYLADVSLGLVDIGQLMIQTGHAVPYEGGPR